MEIIQLPVSQRSPELLFLSARRYTEKYINVPDRVLPDTLKEALDLVRSALSKDFVPSDTTNTYVIQSADGSLSKLYAPVVYRGENGLVIKWGLDIFPLTLTEEKITITNIDAKKFRASTQVTVNDQKDAVLRLTVNPVKSDKAYVIDIRFRLIDLNSDAEFITTYGLSALDVMDLIAPVPEGNGGLEVNQLETLGTGKFAIEGARILGSTSVLKIDGVYYWTTRDLSDFVTVNVNAFTEDAGFVLDIRSIEQGEKYPVIDAAIVNGGFEFSRSLQMYELTVGEYIVKGWRTFSTQYGQRAVFNIQPEGSPYVLPVMAKGTVENAIVSGVLKPNKDNILTIERITPPKGNQKYPQVSAVLEDPDSAGLEDDAWGQYEF